MSAAHLCLRRGWRLAAYRCSFRGRCGVESLYLIGTIALAGRGQCEEPNPPCRTLNC